MNTRPYDAPPHDLLLDAARWLGDKDYPGGGIYPNLLGEPFDVRAMVVWVAGTYVELWQVTEPHDQATQKHQRIKEEIFHRIARIHNASGTPPVPAPTPGPGPAHRSPVGRLVVDGRTLVDGAGAFLGGACSYFHGVRTFVQDRPKFEADAQTMQAMGVDFPRVITDLGWPVIDGVDKQWDGPTHIDALIATIDRWWDFGMRTQVTLLGSLMGATFIDGKWERVWPYRLDNQPARLRYAEAVCAALKGREDKVALVEVCNEPANGAVGPLERDDQAELRALIKTRLPQTLVCLGAPGGHLGATSWDNNDYAWYAAHGDLVLPHLDRGRRDVVDGASYGHIHQGIHSAQDRFTWGNNEPIGPGSSVASESDPTRLRLAATATWMCKGAYYCYHPYSGIGLAGDSNYPLANEPGWRHVFAARAVLPADLPQFSFSNWHWASNPFETLDGVLTDVPGRTTGTVRTLGMSRDNRRVIQVIKVGRDGARMRARERLRLVCWQWETDHYVATEERDYDAGQRFDLAPAEEYLFVGTTR